MKAGWEIKSLGEVIQLEYGKPLPPEDRNPNGMYPAYGANGEKDRTDRFYRDYPSIIVGRKGSAGEITLTEDRFWPLDVTYFVEFDSQRHDLQFLYYLLVTLDLPKLAKGVKPGINRNEVYSLPVAVPTRTEQQRIVAILDQAFEGIATAKANAEKNLQNARQVVNWQLEKVFTDAGPGWIKKRLQDVCERITDGTHQTPTYYNQGVVFLSSRNVTSGKIDWDNIKYIDTKQHLEMHRRVAPRVGDILLAKNGTTGIAAMVDRDVVFDIYVSLALIRPLACVLPAFLLHFINSPVAKHQFNKRLKGVGVPNLHLQEIREVLVTFPESQQEQEKVVKRLDALQGEVGNLTNVYKRKLSALDELKKSLLHQAFTGQL